MSQVSPFVDPRTAAAITIAVLYLWPVALTCVVGAFRWGRLRSRVGFLILGYLACLGVEALVRQFGFVIYWTRLAAMVPGDRLVASFVDVSLTTTVLGMLFSILPLWWLSNLLGRDGAPAAT